MCLFNMKEEKTKSRDRVRMTLSTHSTTTMPTIISQRLLQVCGDGTFHNFSLFQIHSKTTNLW